MQSTVIKIKFTPLITYLQNDNTKCSLEIVPDVSCVENLDKIQWNEKNNIVEYSVPVTYKIILKKDIDKKQDKIYYSCIDLRHISSNSSLACGDITRVVSDNFVLNKVITDCVKNIILSEPIELNKRKIQDSNDEEFCEGENVTNSICMTPEIKEISLKTSEKGYKNRSDNAIDTSNQEYIKLINQNKAVNQICIENTVSKETITELSDLRNNDNTKRKLTITSICTVNTMSSTSSDKIYKERINNNSKTCIKYNHENRVDYKINQISELLSINTILYNEYSKSHNKRTKESSYERILPDIRVAHFMRAVEIEILPLKMLLSDIYRKCASLGLFWKSNILQRSHKCSISQCINKRDIFNEKQIKPTCNRVVYSIVFEE